MKTCPSCAEEIQDAAIVCRYCGTNLAEPGPEGAAPATRSAQGRHRYSDAAVWGAGLFLLGLCATVAPLVLPVDVTEVPGLNIEKGFVVTAVVGFVGLLFALLAAVIRKAWARAAFGTFALVFGIPILMARWREIDMARGYSISVGSDLRIGLAGALAIVGGSLLCIAGATTVPTRQTPEAIATPPAKSHSAWPLVATFVLLAIGVGAALLLPLGGLDVDKLNAGAPSAPIIDARKTLDVAMADAGLTCIESIATSGPAGAGSPVSIHDCRFDDQAEPTTSSMPGDATIYVFADSQFGASLLEDSVKDHLVKNVPLYEKAPYALVGPNWFMTADRGDTLAQIQSALGGRIEESPSGYTLNR